VVYALTVEGYISKYPVGPGLAACYLLRHANERLYAPSVCRYRRHFGGALRADITRAAV
jgi:hypothetical protein